MRVSSPAPAACSARRVCDALLARGDEVVGLTRDPERARHEQPDGHAGTPGTRPIERPPAEALEGVDGSSTWSASRSTSAGPTRRSSGSARAACAATKNLVDAIAAPPSRARVPWSASRRSATTATAASAIVDESTAPGDGFDAEVCVDVGGGGARGRDGRASAWSIFRTGLVLDPRRRAAQAAAARRSSSGVGGPIAGGDQYMPWIHVDDEVGLLLWALDNDGASAAPQRDRAATRSPTASSRRRSAGAAPPRA